VLGILTFILLVGVIGGWSVYARISGAIIAPGTIRVEANRQIVQHAVGGVVSDIRVRNGDTVKAGDILVTLNSTLQRSELAVIEGQLFELWARQLRFKAERDGADALNVDIKIKLEAKRNPEINELIAGQTRLFASRKTSLMQEARQLTKQMSQLGDQIDGFSAQLEALIIQRRLVEEELRDAQVLLKKGLIQNSRVSALEREQARLIGEVGSTTAQIARLRGQISSIEIDQIKLQSAHQEEAISRLRDLQFNEIDLVERRVQIKETLSRLDVRAPVGGVIYGNRVFALGSVISPADPLMFVIPQDQPMIVAARVETIHIDQVHVGQSASLRFAAFDRLLKPEIIGRVSSLSADVFTDEVSGSTFYEAELVPNVGELEKLGGQTLLPGMPVEAFIKTSDRSPLSYLLKPMVDYFNKAFRES
jgi:HlyD family secretion protein